LRIRGYFNADGSPFVDVIVFRRKAGLARRISFLIDTGTPRTVISERDADKLGVTHTDMEKMNADMLGIGGFTQIFKLTGLTFSFITECGEHQREIDEVLVNKHDHLPDRFKKQIPSLLGRDVMGQYALVLDGRAEVVLLSDESVLEDDYFEDDFN
jgi:hypothetical protein